jgi:hypothetical protein
MGASGTAETAQDVSTAVSGPACHKVPDHSCCAKRRSSSDQVKSGSREPHPININSELLSARANLIEIGGGIARECPMAINANALGTRPRSDEVAGTFELAPIDLPLSAVERSSVNPARTFQDNRGHTYLRCCAFLI